MARGRLLNSISDLIVEWATAHSTRSVRDFLMNEKKLTDRQYRYVIGRAPLLNWTIRRGEIQNSIAATKIERLAEQAVEVHWDFIRSAKIGTAKIREGLMRLDSPEADSEALVDCLKALESCQTVFLRAMGVPDGQGLLQQYYAAGDVIGPNKKPSDTQEFQNLTYDDIMILVELKREQRDAQRARSA